MNNKSIPVVGQTVWSLNVGISARYRSKELTEMVVTKVGNKYFYAAIPEHKDIAHMQVKVHIDTWKQCTEYSPSHAFYEKPQDWYDEKEWSDGVKQIRSVLSYANRERLSLDQVRGIVAILGDLK